MLKVNNKDIMTFFILIFQIFQKNMDICGLHYPISTKLQILIELTNTKKCSSFKSIRSVILSVTAYFNEFNVTHKKCKNTSITKEDVFYTFIYGNSLNLFKCGIFHHSGCVFVGQNLLLKSSVFSVTYINSPMLSLT